MVRPAAHNLRLVNVALPAAWRERLAGHHDSSPGLWLVLARQGHDRATSLTDDQAPGELLCQG